MLLTSLPSEGEEHVIFSFVKQKGTFLATKAQVFCSIPLSIYMYLVKNSYKFNSWGFPRM